MHKTTLLKIKDSALYLEELLGWEAEILKIEKFIAEPSHRRSLKRLIKFLNETTGRLELPLQMAYEILKLLNAAALTNEEIGAKIGKSPESVKQAIAALKAGGIEFIETSTGKHQAIGRPRKQTKKA